MNEQTKEPRKGEREGEREEGTYMNEQMNK